MKLEILVHAFVAAVLLPGCLPGDIRPEPGRVYVTAEASGSSVEGFQTDDGWTIQFERLLAGLGSVALRGEECADYSNTRYDRLFDFTVPGAEKLGEVYGLGTCDVRVRLTSPSDDALLEKGTTAADLAFMREPTVELPDNLPISGFGDFTLGTAAYARGIATRAGVTKRFDWQFSGRISIGDCVNMPDDKPTSAFELRGGDDLRPKVTFHGDELFRASAENEAPLRFDELAAADSDADGNVTLAELEKLTAPMVEMEEPMMPSTNPFETPVAAPLKGLAGYINNELLQRTVYLDGVRCKERVQRRD